MALSDLVAKISTSAKKEVAKIETKTAQEIEQLEADFETNINARKLELEKATIAKKEAMQKKVNSLAKTEKRNLILKAKQAILEEALDLIVTKITHLSEHDYEALLTTLFQKTGNIEGAIFHSPKGKENITISAMKKAKMAYKQGASVDIQGGFILVSKTQEVDNSIESLVKNELKDKIQLEISKTLFS